MVSDIKLFRVSDNKAVELDGGPMKLEKELQGLVERNMERFLGVRFLCSEYSTGKSHRGRIDSLGLDENSAPVIVEYKRDSGGAAFVQGLFYLDWLMDHKAEFSALVTMQLGAEVAKSIDWVEPRLLCIASDFSYYDNHAIKQIDRNIDLIKYRYYDNEYLLLELVNSVSVSASAGATKPIGKASSAGSGKYKTASEYLAEASPELQNLYEELRQQLLSFDEGVQEKTLKNYFAFKRIKNFACVQPLAASQRLLLSLKIDPDSIELVDGFTRDVRNIGHYGTGGLEVTITSVNDLQRAMPLIARSYEAS